MEYRVICAHFGDDSHQLHKWAKLNEKGCKQSVIDLNHQAEMQPNFYATCAPYVAQSREPEPWTELTE